MSNKKSYPTINEPVQDIRSLHETIRQLKETVEILSQQRGDPLDYAITYRDLLAMGLIIPSQVPRSNRG